MQSGFHIDEPGRHIGMAIPDVVSQAPFQDPPQRLGEPGPGQVARHAIPTRRLPGDEPDGQSRERPQVRSLIDLAWPTPLLGRPEPFGATRLGEPRVAGQVLAHPQVGQEQAFVGGGEGRTVIPLRRDGRAQQHVVGAQVAVHQRGLVEGFDRGRQRAGEDQQVRGTRSRATGLERSNPLSE